MRRTLVGLALVLAILAAVVLVRTARFTSRQIAVEPVPVAAIDGGAVGRLAGALRFRTVSHQDPGAFDEREFQGLQRYLEESFPRVHRSLTREIVAGHSLLFTWAGRESGAKPVLLLAHLDVVPAEAEPGWAHPPFAGAIADGFVWGRGAIDDKGSVLGLLEAVEMLLGQGFQPRRTLYLAFGHDEEVGGRRGAATMARLLGERKVAAEYVLDEGLAVTQDFVPGVAAPIALVGIAEKGYLSLELVVDAEGGHSSRPPRETAIGILAAAIHRLEGHPAPAAIAGAASTLFEFLGPEMPFTNRLALANLWLFGPLVARRLSSQPETDALVRTTTAPTMLEGSTKENVLPTRARAVINFRIRPGDTVASVIEHVRTTVGDPRVTITPLRATRSDPSPESRVDSPVFATLARTIRQVFPGAIVAPSLVLGATDSRHYAALSEGIFRFMPIHLRPEDAHRAHGIDERIAVTDYEGAIRFYLQLIRNSQETAS